MSPARVVYVVDDDDAVRNAVRLLFRTADLEVETFPSAAAFLERADLERRCCLLLDIRMPGMTGTDLHDELLGRGVRAPVIFITGHGDIPMAVEAMKKGAYDFIEKPFDDEHLLSQVLGALRGLQAGIRRVARSRRCRCSAPASARCSTACSRASPTARSPRSSRSA